MTMDNLQGITVLVTGAAGYIGAHVCAVLADKNATLIMLDDKSTAINAAAVQQWGDLHHVDITNESAVNDIFAANTIDAVIHFAAKTQVEQSFEQPELYKCVNVDGTANIINAMQAHGVKHLIFSGTAAIYGLGDGHTPIPEDAALTPMNPYGETKQQAENLITAASINHVILRYFNAIGCMAERGLGFDFDNGSTVLTKILQAAMKPEASFTLNGDDYETRDGTTIRDFIDIRDLASAHYVALLHLLKGEQSAILNVGTGTGHSMKELLQAVQEIVPHDFTIRTGPRREGDPVFSVADITKIKNVLGWEPQYTDLRDTIQNCLAFIAENKKAA